MKKKLVILADPLDVQVAGIHTYLLSILTAIYKIDNRFDVTIIRSVESQDYPKWQTIVVPIKKTPLHQRWRQLTTIPHILNKINPDIVLEPAHFGPFRLRDSIKRVTVIHDLTPLTHPQYHDKASQIAHKCFLPSIIRKSNQLITVSQCSRKNINELFPLSIGKTSVVPLAPREKPKQHTTNQIDSDYILTVGTVEPRKNHIELISAFEKIKNKKIKLVIAGKIGWKSDKILNRIKSSTRSQDIIMTGYVNENDLASLYKHAALFVYTSLYEGFGLPILEAMQHGIPVICANYSSLPEVGGNAAAYYKLGNHSVLSDTIDRLLNDSELREEMSYKGKKNAAKYTWRKTAFKTLDILFETVRS